jgi:hypothetical protein
MYAAQLVDVEKGTQTTLATGSVLPGLSFSPDGTRIAVGMNGTKPLSVFKPADGSTVTWGMLPPTVTRVFQTAFVDAATLCLRVMDGTAQVAYMAPAGSGATLLSPSGTRVAVIQVPHTTQTEGPPRYLFASTTVMNGVGDLQLYDLQAASPSPTQIAMAASVTSLEVSNSQSTARFLENYMFTASRGTLTLQVLPATAAPHALAPNIFPQNVSNVPIDEVAFVDTFTENGTLEVYKGGSTSPVANGVSNQRIRLTPTSQLYFSVSMPDTIIGLQPGIYAMPLP